MVCTFSENLREAEIKGNGIGLLEEKTSRHHSSQVVAWVLPESRREMCGKCSVWGWNTLERDWGCKPADKRVKTKHCNCWKSLLHREKLSSVLRARPYPRGTLIQGIKHLRQTNAWGIFSSVQLGRHLVIATVVQEKISRLAAEVGVIDTAFFLVL